MGECHFIHATRLNVCTAFRTLNGMIQAKYRANNAGPAKLPLTVRALHNIATVLVEIGRTDDALKHLSSAHPPAISHYNLGQLLNRRDRTKDAVVWFQRALQIDPNLVPAQQMLHRLGGHPVLGPGTAAGQLSSGPATVNPRPPYAGNGR